MVTVTLPTQSVVIPMPDEWDSVLVRWHLPDEEFNAWVLRLGLETVRHDQRVDGVDKYFFTASAVINQVPTVLFTHSSPLTHRHVEVSINRA